MNMLIFFLESSPIFSADSLWPCGFSVFFSNKTNCQEKEREKAKADGTSIYKLTKKKDCWVRVDR